MGYVDISFRGYGSMRNGDVYEFSSYEKKSWSNNLFPSEITELK